MDKTLLLNDDIRISFIDIDMARDSDNIDSIQGLVINSDIIKLALENDEIYITTTKLNIVDAELNNSIDIVGNKVYYGEYKDADSGMIPFFIDKGNYLLKIIAKDVNLIDNIIE